MYKGFVLTYILASPTNDKPNIGVVYFNTSSSVIDLMELMEGRDGRDGRDGQDWKDGEMGSSGEITHEYQKVKVLSTYESVDKNAESITWTGSQTLRGIFMHVETKCETFLCPPYETGKERICIDCTK